MFERDFLTLTCGTNRSVALDGSSLPIGFSLAQCSAGEGKSAELVTLWELTDPRKVIWLQEATAGKFISTLVDNECAYLHVHSTVSGCFSSCAISLDTA